VAAAVPDHGPKVDGNQPGLVASSTTTGWHANPRLASPSEDLVRAKRPAPQLVSGSFSSERLEHTGGDGYADPDEDHATNEFTPVPGPGA
jgi:hypothetical protein